MTSDPVRTVPKVEFQHAIYPLGKSMHFQSQPGQTKVVFDNQVKNEQQCVVFLIEIFLVKFEIACRNVHHRFRFMTREDYF